jgi:hypothetical protein
MDKLTLFLICFFLFSTVLSYAACFYYLYKTDECIDLKLAFLKKEVWKLKKKMKKMRTVIK